MGETPFKIVIAMAAGEERGGLAGELAGQGYAVEIFERGNELWDYLNSNPEPHVLLLDTDISGADTEELLEAIGGSKLNVCPLLITDEDTANMAAVWSSLGAWCYMLRPINWGLLDMHFERIKRHFQTLAENMRLCGCMAAWGETVQGGACASPAMRRTFEEAKKAAAGESPVFLPGESGSDKLAVACEIHSASRRRSAPFVTLDRASYSPSEEKESAPRGCYAAKTLLDAALAAQGGTLFIEEVFALSPADRELLLKILRPADEPAGDEEREDIPRNLRVIAATSANLALEVGNGAFPGELFNEISRRTISVPPLRERAEDIPQLAARRVELVSPDPARPKTISPAALEILSQYYWPGNERELFNVVERAAAHSQSAEIQAEEILAILTPSAPGSARVEEGQFFFPSLNLPLEAVEKEYISRVLSGHDFHRERTSRSLGISRKTLYLKIKEYKLGENAAQTDENNNG